MRKTLILALLALCCITPSACEQKPPYLDPGLPIPARVRDLLSRLTLEEKISQIAVPSLAIERLGIPAYDWRGECLHGLWSGDNVTCFPQAIGMAATFDPDLIYQVATAISDEAVAQHWEFTRQGRSTFRDNFTYWNPNINLYRDPRWGRGQETFGEDPYLVSTMGVNFIKGMQGDDPKYLKVAAAPKHFAVHSGPDEIRHQFRAEVNPHDFWDAYMPQFEAAIKEAKAAGIMAAYSGINGIPCHANPMLLGNVLRKGLGFEGFIVSDGGGVNKLLTGQKYARDSADAAKLALQAGVDLENQRADYPTLLKQAKDGTVSDRRVDEALGYLLAARFRWGGFDPPEMIPYTRLPYSLVGCPKHRALALKTAQESIVLLENDGILPLQQGKYKKIAVIGPAADAAEDLYGNYFAGKPAAPVSLLAGIRKAAGPRTNVLHAAGCGYTELLDSGPVPSAALIPASGESGEHGLKAEYFSNIDLKGAPVLTRVDKQIDFNWGEKSPYKPPSQQADAPKAVPADRFSVRWTGKLVPAESGRYELTLKSDDGSRLYLDGKLVIDNWRNSSKNVGVYEVELVAGRRYGLRVEYYDLRINANVRLAWRKPANTAGQFAQAIKAADESDLVIAAVGMNSRMSTESRDWPSYALPEVQQRLLEALKTTGKPLVVVLIGGNPLDLNWQHENANALLHSWFPGEEGGTAVADVLFGSYNPSGRLPVTFYKSIADVPAATDYAMQNRTYRYFRGKALYPFGYGLSYTSFAYSDLTVTADATDATASVTRASHTATLR